MGFVVGIRMDLMILGDDVVVASGKAACQSLLGFTYVACGSASTR